MISTHSLRILSINSITTGWSNRNSNDVKHDGRIWTLEGMSSYTILFFLNLQESYVCLLVHLPSPAFPFWTLQTLPKAQKGKGDTKVDWPTQFCRTSGFCSAAAAFSQVVSGSPSNIRIASSTFFTASLFCSLTPKAAQSSSSTKFKLVSASKTDNFSSSTLGGGSGLGAFGATLALLVGFAPAFTFGAICFEVTQKTTNKNGHLRLRPQRSWWVHETHGPETQKGSRKKSSNHTEKWGGAMYLSFKEGKIIWLHQGTIFVACKQRWLMTRGTLEVIMWNDFGI